MAESIVASVIKLVGLVVDRYERNGTARGLLKQADELLAEAHKNLSQDMDPEDISSIKQSLVSHPELISLEMLKDRYKKARGLYILHKDQLNHASSLQRAWVFSQLVQSVRGELEVLRELDEDITATTACPARSTTKPADVPKPKRESRRSKFRASIHKLAKFGRFARDMDRGQATADAQNATNYISVGEKAEGGCLDLREIQETLDKLSQLVATGGDDFEQQVDEILVQLLPRFPSPEPWIEDEEMAQLKSAPIITFLTTNMPTELKVTHI